MFRALMVNEVTRRTLNYQFMKNKNFVPTDWYVQHYSKFVVMEFDGDKLESVDFLYLKDFNEQYEVLGDWKNNFSDSLEVSKREPMAQWELDLLNWEPPVLPVYKGKGILKDENVERYIHRMDVSERFKQLAQDVGRADALLQRALNGAAEQYYEEAQSWREDEDPEDWKQIPLEHAADYEINKQGVVRNRYTHFIVEPDFDETYQESVMHFRYKSKPYVIVPSAIVSLLWSSEPLSRNPLESIIMNGDVEACTMFFESLKVFNAEYKIVPGLPSDAFEINVDGQVRNRYTLVPITPKFDEVHKSELVTVYIEDAQGEVIPYVINADTLAKGLFQKND